MNLYKFLNNISLKREIYFLEKKIYSRLTEKKSVLKYDDEEKKHLLSVFCLKKDGKFLEKLNTNEELLSKRTSPTTWKYLRI